MLISRSDRGLVARWWFTVDLGLISAVFLLMAVGVLVSMAAGPPVAERIGLDAQHFFRSQLMYLSFAAPLFLAMTFLEGDWIRRAAFVGFIGTAGLMVAALLFGPEIKGAHRWISVGPVSIQPSELAKPFFTVALAWFLSDHLRKPDMPGRAVGYGLVVLMLALLILQPDFGQAMLVSATVGAMLLVSGLSWMMIFSVVALGVAGIGSAYLLLPHVASRFDRFFSPDKGDSFQVDTAIQAFRNGGFAGTGPGSGTAKLVLPDVHTDFALASIGEEYGVIACMVLILVFAFIVLRVLVRARKEEDPFRALALAGLATMFGAQTFINFGVNTALLPAKGMTLPFVSYGGSSLVGTAIALGFIASIGRSRPGAIGRKGVANVMANATI
jgi:cell division protein FtsW